jgi:predicted nucleic acid-binding protein
MDRSELLWLDSDVLLDWLANRKPWDAAATEIIERAILGDWALCFSPLTLANVHYIYRKHSGNAGSLSAIATLVKIGSIATMDSSHVRQALASGHSDFEDELQIASASALSGLTAIITRNLTDYSHSPVPAMTAQDWLLQHPGHPNEAPSG